MQAIFYRFLQTVFLCAILLVGSLNAFAQDRQVTGKTTGSDGPVPGVNIVLKGTQTGTTSDANGNFKISVRGSNPVLVISAIGTKTQEITVGNQTNIEIKLEDDATALSEVVVTGYSTENRRDVTGAVSTVKPAQLKVVPSTNVEQQLQGRVAGVTVITNGQPGTTSQIRVRGFGSFGGNQPLYVVDGVPTQNVQYISPDDIESTTVLKDAAAASIYGARAASGVIVITTKRGQRHNQKLSITYDGLYGVTDPGHGPKILNPQEQADWAWQARKNDIYQAGGTVGPDSFTGIANGQYGSGPTPVLPDYLLVGTSTGLSASQVDLTAEAAKYNVNPLNGAIYNVIPSNKAGTDWYGAITRVAPLTRHTLGFSGGTDASRFYISIGMQNQAGIVTYNNFSRYSLRANTEFDITKKLRFGENFQLTYISNTGVLGSTGSQLGNGTNNNSSSSTDENDVLTAFRIAPIIPIYNSFGGYAGTAAKGFNNPNNPVANRDAAKNNGNFNIFGFGNAYLEYDVIPDLTLKSSIGGTYFNNYYNSYGRVQYENSENNTTYTYSEGSGYGLAWTFTNTASYKHKFGIHDLAVLGGIESLNTGAGRSISGSGQNPFSTDPNYVTISTTTPGATRQVGSSYGLGNKFFSLFAQARYTFNDKYILTGVVRRDGSSQFASSNRYGVFPAVSGAWRISSEEFMKNLPWVSDLKIRGGYGIMGNSNFLSATNQYNLFASNAANGYDINASNGSVGSGFYRSQIGNPAAKWESSITSNIGVDGSFFNNKLEVSLDFWRKDTRDLLFQLSLPGVVGDRASAPYSNVASMRNQGIDLLITNRGNVTKDLGYEVTLVGGFLQNNITSLAPGVPYFTAVGNSSQRLSVPVIRNQPGHPLSSFYGYNVIGLFNSKEEVAAAPTQDGAAPGRFRYQDVNGDGKIDDSDRTFLGSPIPKFTGSITVTLRYKGFDLNTNIYASLGSQIFNYSKWYTDFNPSFTGAAVSARVKDSWLPTHTNTTVPIFETASNFSTNTQATSYYVENGSYGRMQYLTLGYTVPAAMLNKIHMSRLRISLTATNLFTITKYKGLDPSVGGAADTSFGVDVGNYPITRAYNVGLSFGL
ncbi:SusC/RagA family TonB-linked outer membrane protein [Spirosoma sp. HMF4905]|uniref:SusC/RagA family TonB-linked outer membrane protein n=1 Tax=Spirosoma arboris TaxID=2682092 RepID=A0A7K1SEF7_9BACT|nr:TonB-dependent receptor [Spirosoma arboris]MVM32195.1 SusC/RagA family TonB-linked outer membrane protein [Spirosoma arboris]